MNKLQLLRYLHDTERKADLLSWHIKTVLGDLKVFKMTKQRHKHWLDLVHYEQTDLNMFNEEIRIIKEQLESAK